MIVDALRDDQTSDTLIVNCLQCLAHFFETGIQVLKGRREMVSTYRELVWDHDLINLVFSKQMTHEVKAEVLDLLHRLTSVHQDRIHEDCYSNLLIVDFLRECLNDDVLSSRACQMLRWTVNHIDPTLWWMLLSKLDFFERVGWQLQKRSY